ncbi:hypothetical protein N7520_004690 [Penicillium odoratum]|uniref:uncharacterized protein n=1 Tax=Penicillium odoratum TaxID=1167516 RepID=UPI002549748A|nr:uncharacterized protein N7520_004690 [Penicillium odoratum]KAJ5765131.1 hypothetical protein N7520_004690 [Penicillium odoratum]
MSNSPTFDPMLDPPAPIIDGTDQPPSFWAHSARNPMWQRARPLPLLREPTLASVRAQSSKRWPWEGPSFDHFLSTKKENCEALLAQATGELIEGATACTRCRYQRGMFDGCVRVHGRANCPNCHIGAHYDKCSLTGPIPTTPTAPTTAAPQDLIPSLNGRSLQQLLEKARSEQADLQAVID